jgi:malate dehydrogenase (oxaloacetate-decarboxylating)(NADP+)
MSFRRQDALDYHSEGRRGKIAVVPTKPALTQRDLSLAYSPGVAEPCREIARDPDEVFRYTARGNLVAVVSNGTAVLGLGDIGPLAAKPVMEGKGVLFKRFADIDVYDLEVDSTDPDDVIRFCQLLEPTVGGINLEDIRAPECFYIEQELQKLDIPVFHDDQHGTAVISGAALLNALEVTGRKIEEVKVVFSGAGAAAIATAEHYVHLGVPREHIVMCDREGVIHSGRDDLDPFKAKFARETPLRTLAEAMRGADLFVGLSVAGAVTPEMVASMAERPIVFALANPDPEITPEEVLAVRPDAITATGRSDYPNQINNVLGFPFIFRGALDVRARRINTEMKMAATRALAELAREAVPESVERAYRGEQFRYGPDYLIPKPFDPRIMLWVAPAVAEAAMQSGVARLDVDLERYRADLERRLGRGREVMRGVFDQAKRDPRRIAYPEGENPRIIRAAIRAADAGIAYPLLVGRPERIRQTAEALGVDLNGHIELIDPAADPERKERYAQEFYRLRHRKGITLAEARERMRQPVYFASMMTRLGDADGMLSGADMYYPDTLRPALETIGTAAHVDHVAGLYMMVLEKELLFFADTTVNIEPDAETLADIALLAAGFVRRLGIEPKVAMLSFSNFGSVRHPHSDLVRRATERVKARDPELVVDGEMQADTAVVPEMRAEVYPFSALQGEANVLVFPDLNAANIAYKLLARLGGAEAIGPVLLGMARPVHVLERGSDTSAIVNLTALAVVDAQERNGDGT